MLLPGDDVNDIVGEASDGHGERLDRGVGVCSHHVRVVLTPTLNASAIQDRAGEVSAGGDVCNSGRQSGHIPRPTRRPAELSVSDLARTS
jgi:hypothetical protein